VTISPEKLFKRAINDIHPWVHSAHLIWGLWLGLSGGVRVRVEVKD